MKVLLLILSVALWALSQAVAQQAQTTQPASQTSQPAPQRLDKTSDLEIRLLGQKITTKELQIQQLSQQVQADRKALNDLVASACKSKSIEVKDCEVRVLNDEAGEYVAVSSSSKPATKGTETAASATAATTATKKEKN